MPLGQKIWGKIMNVRTRANHAKEFRINNHNNMNVKNGSRALFSNQNIAKSQNNLFDYLFSALSILLLSDNFWQIIIRAFPQSKLFGDEIIIETLQSAILALGFVGIAVKWEIATKIMSRFFILLIGIALAIVSVFWSYDPALSLHQALNFSLLIAFSLALALRFDLKRLSLLAFSIGLFAIFAQFALELLQLPQMNGLLFKNGEIAFLLVTTVWACYANQKYQYFLAPIALFCAMIGIFAQDIIAIGVIISMFAAWAIINIFRISQSVEIGIAGAISIFMFLGAIFILFNGNAVSIILSNAYSEINLNTILGQGFAIGENTIAGNFGKGLGFLGLSYGMLFLFFCMAIISIKARTHKYISLVIFGFFTIAFLGMGTFPLISLPIIFLIATIASSFNSLRR